MHVCLWYVQHTHIHAYTHTHTWAVFWRVVNLPSRDREKMYIYIYMYTYIYMHMHIYIPGLCFGVWSICQAETVRKCTDPSLKLLEVYSQPAHVCQYACMYVYVRVCVCVCIYIMRTYIGPSLKLLEEYPQPAHACQYVCMCVFMCVYVYTRVRVHILR